MGVAILESAVESAARCPCDGGQPKNFARPCLLLLLAESPAHGYQLMERLSSFGLEINDPASLYKTLRGMEQDGLVTSEWELSSRGPARRVYELTPGGRELLSAWALTLESTRGVLEDFLSRFRRMAITEVRG